MSKITYEMWSDRFLFDRLALARNAALAGMWAFVAVDYIIHPNEFQDLLVYRAITVALLFSFVIFERTGFAKRYPHIIAVAIMWTMTVSISHMTVLLGGITSDYYLGLVMVHLGAAVLYPWDWRLHAMAQIGSFVYWLLINFLSNGLADFFPAGLQAVFVQLTFYTMFGLSIHFYQSLFRERYLAMQGIEDALTETAGMASTRNRYFVKESKTLRQDIDEINNTLQEMFSHAQMNNSHHQETILTPVVEAGKRVAIFLNENLDLATAEAGCVSVNPEVVNLQSFLEVIASRLSSEEQIFVKLPDFNDPVVLLTDRKVLAVGLINLIRYLSTESASREVELSIDERKPDEELRHLHLSSINGVGIPQSVATRVFIPYAAAADHPEATGLPVARYYLRDLGGDVIIKSDIGRGTTFEVLLPLRAKAT